MPSLHLGSLGRGLDEFGQNRIGMTLFDVVNEPGLTFQTTPQNAAEKRALALVFLRPPPCSIVDQ
jgi:hypothetical protein